MDLSDFYGTRSTVCPIFAKRLRSQTSVRGNGATIVVDSPLEYGLADCSNHNSLPLEFPECGAGPRRPPLQENRQSSSFLSRGCAEKRAA
jgi:hypothetical protein